MPRSDIPVITPYNPLDKRNLAESVASAMLHTPVQKLPPEPFIGAGVYAIYYKGDFEPYRKLVELNQDGWNVPIYVGKAVPAGARKGGFGVNVDHGQALANRLSEHFTSVSKASNLDENDFVCRFATVYKGNIIKNLIMDCQSYTKYRPNETTGGIFVSWRRKEELPTGA